MKKKVLAVVCGLSLVFAAGACKKKEEKPPVPQTGMPGQQQPLPPGHQAMMPKGETAIVVPDTIKGKWKGVVLIVEDKTTKKKEELTINLNSDMKVPNSSLKISVGEFLPDFKMDGLTLTSVSNEPNNPAAAVSVSEDGKQIFPVEQGKKWGWLYTKFPTVHPFDHPKYSISLKNGVKKG